jgi:NADPH-dependent ferric siderophore reductase
VPRRASCEDRRTGPRAAAIGKPVEKPMTTNPAPETSDAAPNPPRRRRVLRHIRATRVARLSPKMVRVTFTGDDLAAFAWNGPAAHIKLGFPGAGEAEPPSPTPDGPRPAIMRTYTPRRFDPAVPELDVEFVLHGDGPAAAWAAQAEAGQALLLGGPGPNYQIDPDAAWFVLLGDDAALPAIATILEALPAGARATVLLEVADVCEERPLATPATAALAWLHRDPDPARAGAALEAAVRALPLPEGDGRIYVGCEAAAMRRIRRHLLGERGVDPSRIVTRGYWKLGDTNYTDHDYGTDE